MPVIPTPSIYVIKDVRTRGYFWKPKGVRKQKFWERIAYAMAEKLWRGKTFDHAGNRKETSK
jgi:hypothetical protein